MSTPTCPDCQEPLNPHTYLEVTVDMCGGCGGIWFDQGEMKALMQRDPVSLISLEEDAVPHLHAKPELPSIRRCPECDRGLDAYQYAYSSPVQLDACADCGGIWVQDGELDKIRVYLETPDRARAAERRAVAFSSLESEHAKEMRRQEGLHRFFSLLYIRRPGWLRA